MREEGREEEIWKERRMEWRMNEGSRRVKEKEGKNEGKSRECVRE